MEINNARNWQEHGYTRDNAQEALELFVSNGKIIIEAKNLAESTSDDERSCVQKIVSVPSLEVYDIPIKGYGLCLEEAEIDCNLKIMGELYRYEVIGPANIELADTPSDIAITRTSMDKFQLPTHTVANSSTLSQSTINDTTSSNNFLASIETKRTTRNNGQNQIYNEHGNGKRKDATLRKFFAPMKSVEEMVNEQREMTSAAITQRRLPIQIYGGDNKGKQYIISSFNEIRLTDQIRDTLNALNYNNLTDVQKCVIPLIQKTNNDIICLAATGSGKTAAFLIPLIHRIQGLRLGPQGEQKPINVDLPFAIVVAHTRELVEQLYKTAHILANYTGVGVALARGRMPDYECRKQLEEGCDILVITPGKLTDYLNHNRIKLDNVHFIVIDEADKFISEDDFANGLHELKENIRRTNNIQCRTFMFSATLNEVAQCIIDQFLQPNFYHIIVGKVNQVVSHVRQHIYEIKRKHSEKNPKMAKLREILLGISRKITAKDGEHFIFDTEPTIVFANESRRSDRIAIQLSRMGFRAMSINGHRSHEQRHKAMEDFKSGLWHILVGTDVIARGMNFPSVNNVILFELPPTHRYEQYVHRVGRTGRISESGQAFIFFDPFDQNDSQLGQFLARQLRESGQYVPEFLAEIEEDRVELQVKLAEWSTHENAITNINTPDYPSDQHGNCDEFRNTNWQM